ncbi:hypothetical protein [Streptomyces angustmyceticus]|uniref:hypothetical protein n=1 Tax=Streptomyces angustmyceticus TaxID=285578 RepID=UPI0036F1FEBC
MGLLGVTAGGVPASGGEGDQDQGRDEHGGGAAVFAPAECAAGLDDAPGRRADRPGIGALRSDVTAGRPLEFSGSGSQLGAGGGRGSLGDRVQEFSDPYEVSCGVVVVAVEQDGGVLGDAGGALVPQRAGTRPVDR